MNNDGASSPCVLVAEFDPLQRDLIVLTLNRSGYNPVVCPDPAEIRAMMQARRPAVLLMDLVIPGLNSLDLLRSMNQEGLLARCAAIAISALAFKEVVRQAIQAGASDFLVKPINPDLLLDRVHRASRGRAAVPGASG